jgi:hypothetical protein
LLLKEAEIRRITVRSQSDKQLSRPYLENTHSQKGLGVAQDEGPESNSTPKNRILIVMKIRGYIRTLMLPF